MPSWDAVAATAEMVGALGVIATLAYLAGQIRQNTRALRSQATLDANRSFAEVNDYLATSPDLLELVVRAQLSGRLADLTPEEQVRFGVWCRALLLRVECQFELHRNGFLADEHWAARRAWVRGYLDQPASATWWESEKTQSLYSPAFIAEMEGAPGIRVNMAGIESLVAPERP
jgi:hypothetical protein